MHCSLFRFAHFLVSLRLPLSAFLCLALASFFSCHGVNRNRHSQCCHITDFARWHLNKQVEKLFSLTHSLSPRDKSIRAEIAKRLPFLLFHNVLTMNLRHNRVRLGWACVAFEYYQEIQSMPRKCLAAIVEKKK